MLKKHVIHIGILILFSISSFAQTAAEIIKTADQKFRGKSSHAELTIDIVRAKWSKKMKMKTWSQGDNYSVSVVTSPAKEKGIVFLMRDKEMWNYMPNIDRTIKFPPSMMMQNWMGTDLTNDDLVKMSSMVEDYEQEVVGEETKEGLVCWKIQLTPKADAAVVWGKIFIWIDQGDYMQMQVDYYDEDAFLVNQMIASEIKDFEGKKLPSKMRIIPIDKSGQETIITYQKWVFDLNINNQYFTKNYMKRIR